MCALRVGLCAYVLDVNDVLVVQKQEQPREKTVDARELARQRPDWLVDINIPI